MALFTATPINILGVSPFMPIGDAGNNQGRFVYGGNYYYVGYGEDVSGVIIAKSTDQGASWSYFQESSPLTASADVQGVFDPSAGLIHFIGSKTILAVVNITYKSFDLNAETFSSRATLSAAPQVQLGIAIRPNGDIRVFYSQGGAVKFVAISAGSFGSPSTFAATGSSRSCVSDSSGVIHVVYVAGGALKYNTLSAADSVGTAATIDASFGGTSIGAIVFSLGSIFVVPTANFTGGSIAQFYEGKPAASPVWTGPTDLHSTTTGVDDVDLCVVDAGSEAWFFYTHEDGGSPPVTAGVMRVRYDGSTLQTPEVYWDAVDNPPPGMSASTFQEFDGIAVSKDAGGLAIAVTCNIDDDEDISAVYLPIDAVVTRRAPSKFY